MAEGDGKLNHCDASCSCQQPATQANGNIAGVAGWSKRISLNVNLCTEVLMANRCRKCGAVMEPLVTLTDQRRLWVCHCGQSRINDSGNNNRTRIYLCGNVQDNNGTPFIGTGTFITDGVPRLLTVSPNGDIRSRAIRMGRRNRSANQPVPAPANQQSSEVTV